MHHTCYKRYIVPLADTPPLAALFPALAAALPIVMYLGGDTYSIDGIRSGNQSQVFQKLKKLYGYPTACELLQTALLNRFQGGRS